MAIPKYSEDRDTEVQVAIARLQEGSIRLEDALNVVREDVNDIKSSVKEFSGELREVLGSHRTLMEAHLDAKEDRKTIRKLTWGGLVSILVGAVLAFLHFGR